MENKLLKIIMATVIGIIVIGAVLVPIVNNSLSVVGEPITVTQSGTDSPYLLGNVPNNETVTIEVVEGGIKVNDVLINPITVTSTWTPLVLFDTGYVAIRNETGACRISHFVEGEEITTTSINVGVFMTASNGVITINTETPITFEYSLCYSVGYSDDVCLLIDMGYRFSGRYSVVNDITDIMIYSYYGSGNYDTFYQFVDGELTTGGDYEHSVSYDLQLMDGTTDIYEIHSFEVTIEDETFIPYFALVPYEIHGHADHGGAYSVLSVVPVVVILALLVMVIGVFSRSRY